jgi:hypothetical protein
LLLFLGAAFILCYHLFFTFDSFHTVFGGDDGMNLLKLHHHWEVPLSQSVFQALQVVTSAYRPMGALFYRPMYQIFGFDPLAFRIALFLILVVNIWMVYLLARQLEAPRPAAALACLLFSYNAGMMDIQYNIGTIYDLLCFLFYIPALLLYVRRRSSGATLRIWEMAAILVLFGSALDSKELAVTLPAVFLLYELVYRTADLRRRVIVLTQPAFLAALLLLTALYSHAKVTEMSGNDLYRPRPSLAFALGSYGHYFEQLLYRKPESYTILAVILTIGVLLALCLAIRSRPAIFGALFFLAALAPVSLIPHRGGFAAYIAFPGLTLAAGCLLDTARRAFVRFLKIERHRESIAIALFLLVAYGAGRFHIRIRNRLLPYMHHVQHNQAEVMTLMQQRLPDLPPDSRLLLLDGDAFPPGDWIIYFLTRMLYNDSTVWLDRQSTLGAPPDLPSYDFVIHYQPSLIDEVPLRMFGFRWKWEPRSRQRTAPIFTVTSERSDATEHPVTFEPPSIRAGQSFTLTVPEIAGTQIDVVYRLLSGGKEDVHRATGWCTLDAKSSCTVPAPELSKPASLVMDWVRPSNGKWRRTTGALQINSR